MEHKDNTTLCEGRTSAVATPSLEGKTETIVLMDSNVSLIKVRELQRRLTLSAKTRPNRFYLLYDKVYRKDVLIEAWEQVRSNKGSAGVDGITIEEVEARGVGMFLTEIRDKLKTGNYRLHKVRKVEIPKPDGRKRALGIPTVADRVVQTAIKLIIEPIFEIGFENCSYGFRPNRNAKQASLEVYKWLNFGYTTVIDIDIKSCFDNIPQDKLMRLIESKIADKKLLKLIKACLRSGILQGDTIFRDTRGIPQGSPLSPLLANIYLNQFDKNWKTNTAHLVRYADDMVILTKINYGEKVYQKAKNKLSEIGLMLNETKSKIAEAREGFEFLGYRFIRRWKQEREKWQNYVLPTKEAIARIRQKIKQIVNKKSILSPRAITEKVNPVLRGWANYYTHTNAKVSYEKIQKFVEDRIRRYLRFLRHKGGKGYRDYPREYLTKIFGLVDIRGGVCYVR